MRTHVAVNYATALGRLLTRMLSVCEARSESAASRCANYHVNGDTSTVPGVVIRSLRDALKAQCSQPVIVNPGPMLALLLMLRKRAPRRDRIRWRELSLPSGCVLAARYMSR